MRRCRGALPWLVLPLILGTARGDDGTPTIERVDPPSWWAEPEEQQVTLLIEGSGLEGAEVRSGRGALRIDRVEAGSEGRYLFVDATIAAGAEPGPIEIEVRVGDGPAARRRWDLVARPSYRARPIGPDDVIYLVMPDRFADGDPANNEPAGDDRMLNRRDTHSYHGGDFRGLSDHLPYLADLGVTALWITPIYRPAPRWYSGNLAGTPRPLADFHGYSPVEFYETNPRFGTADDYRALVAEAHRLGLKVIQDQIVGFVGPQHRWAKHPPSPTWFHGPIDRPPACNFRFDAAADPHAAEPDRRGLTDGWFFGILPDLDTRDPRVKRYAIQQSLWWATLFEADGIRLDTYPMVDRPFWRDWSRRLAEVHPEMRAVGEAWVPDAADLSFFQGGHAGWDGIDPGIASVFDFPLFEAAQLAFSDKAPASRLARALSRDGLFPRPDLLVTFLDNHDTMRLSGLVGLTPARYRVAAAFLLTTRGIPQMTWGDEIALPGHMDDRRDFPGGFPGDARDAFTPKGRSRDEQAAFDAYRALLHLRRSSPALRRGRLVDLVVEGSMYAYLREHDDERLVVVLNLGARESTVRIPADRLGVAVPDSVASVYGDARVAAGPEGLSAIVPAESAAVVRLGGEPKAAEH